MAPQKRPRRLAGEGILEDFQDFPDRFRKNASQAIAASFRNPEIATAMSYFDRQKMLDTLVGIMGTREELMGTYEGVRFLDTVQTILSVIMDDAFYSSEGDIFEVLYDEGMKEESDTQLKINKMIQEFMKQFRIQALIKNLMEDFLLLGEYPLRVVVSPNGNGIIDIVDDLDPITTIGVYEIDTPIMFLEKSERGYLVRTPKEVVHFNLAPTKIRVKSLDFRMNSKRIPEYLRIGRSVIYPALQKLKQLQTIELAATITDLKRAIAPILVSVAVPANSQPEDVTEVIKKYEQHLQETYRGMPDLENPTMGDLLATVTNFRVVPNFTDGKGAIQTLDLIGTAQDAIDTRIDRLRTSVAMAVGMPPYYLVIGQMENAQASKTEMLKLHSRYARMLASIQNAIADGVRRLVCLHVINKGVFVNDELIKIKFKNVINVEHLDKMEYAVASAQTLRDVWSTLSEILSSDEVPAKLNGPAFINMVNTFLSAGSPSQEPLLIPLSEEEQAARSMPGEGGPGAAGGGGGMGGDLFGADGGGEAPMFDPGADAGGLAADGMENTAEIPPADFGPVGDDGNVEGMDAEAPPEGGLEPEENLGDLL